MQHHAARTAVPGGECMCCHPTCSFLGTGWLQCLWNFIFPLNGAWGSSESSQIVLCCLRWLVYEERIQLVLVYTLHSCEVSNVSFAQWPGQTVNSIIFLYLLKVNKAFKRQLLGFICALYVWFGFSWVKSSVRKELLSKPGGERVLSRSCTTRGQCIGLKSHP